MIAIIFDLDGTLVDTAPDLLAATNAVLRLHGRHSIDPSALRHMVGLGARSLLIQAFAATGEQADATLIPVLVDEFLAHYRANIANQSRPFPHVVDTLELLRRRDVRMGVLTNKPHDLTQRLLSLLGLNPYFRAVLGAGLRSYSKPDPRLFQEIASALGSASAIMVGDSVTDVATARAASAPVILVSYGYTPEPAVQLGADAVTDDFARIPELVDKVCMRTKFGQPAT